MEYWSFAENFGPRADQFSLKILLKTRANSAKLTAFSDSVTPIYPKNDLKFRAFRKKLIFVGLCNR